MSNAPLMPSAQLSGDRSRLTWGDDFFFFVQRQDWVLRGPDRLDGGEDVTGSADENDKDTCLHVALGAATDDSSQKADHMPRPG